MEHCYSVQGQSDKHIDFGTHEVWDMSAPTFHYPIIWFTWGFSSVAKFQSGTSWNVEYCGFEEYLLVKLRKKNIINTVQYELPISWKDHMHYKLYVFAYYHRSLSEIIKECRILYSRLHYSRICLKWFGISWGLKSTADVGNLQPISVCLDWMAVLKVFFFCCCFWVCLFFKSSPTQNLLIS